MNWNDLRFLLALLLAALMTACGDDAPTATSAPGPSESTASVNHPQATPEGTGAAVDMPSAARRRSAETMAQVANIVREARALEHAGEHRAALARFDDALRLVPEQPRVLCEAGLIAHQAGDTAFAADRIDTALRVFGPAQRISDRLRAPLAMCLYNRGLVAEALSEPRQAVDFFERSLALRPNATVESALARSRVALVALPVPSDGATVPAPAPTSDERGQIAGIAIDEETNAVLATDVASLERVLRSAYGGDDELGEGSAEPTSRRVARLHSLQGEGRPEILVYDVSAPSPPLDVRYLVIAIRTARGYLVFEKSLGEQGVTPSWDEDDTVLTLTVTPSWIGSVLRLDARVEVRTTRFVQDESCQERIEELTTTSYAIVCRVERDPRCYALTTGFDTNGGTTWSSCNDEEDGERIDGDPVHASARLTIDDQGVTISGVRGDADALDVEVGAWSWDELPDVMHQPEWQLDE